KSGRQIELNDPATPWPLERSREIQLTDGVAEQVCAQRETCRRDAVARAAEERRLLTAVPGDPAIGEERNLDRNGSIHPRRGTEWAKQREPEFEVAHQHAAAEQAVERRALTHHARHAVRRTKGIDVIAAYQRR